MRLGFAKTNINPPLGMPMEGLRQPHGCEAIHDDLFVRVIYVDDVGSEALIVSFDLLFFWRSDVARFKRAIGRVMGMRPEQIFFNTSHTHAGPRVSRWNYSDGPDAAYLDLVESALLEAAAEAKAGARAVTLWAGMTQNDLPVSRRLLDEKGKAQWKPYRNGTTCDALPFCLFKDSDGRVVAMIFSVSCHPSMKHECIISAEYPGVAIRRLNEHFGTDGALFLQGAGGETKPRHVAVGEELWRRGTWEEMEEAGGEIAEAVIKESENSLTQIEPSLRISLTDLDWPLECIPGREHFEGVLQESADDPFRRRWATDMLGWIDRGEALPQTMPVALHALQLGKGLRLIGVEGEIVAALGLMILAEFPRGVTFPLGYSNGCQAYLTTDAMLPEGGYEVDSFWEYHWPSPLAPGGERVLGNALKQLHDSGKIPCE